MTNYYLYNPRSSPPPTPIALYVWYPFWALGLHLFPTLRGRLSHIKIEWSDIQIYLQPLLYLSVLITLTAFILIAIAPILPNTLKVYKTLWAVHPLLLSAAAASVEPLKQYFHFVTRTAVPPIGPVIALVTLEGACFTAFFSIFYSLKYLLTYLHLKRVLAEKKAEAEAAARKAALTAATNALALAPLEKMYLKLKRSQRYNMWGSVIFVLDARMDVPAGARQYIYTYGLGNRLVYESEDRQKHRQRALAHGMASADAAGSMGWTPSVGQIGKSVLKTAWQLSRAGVSAARTAMALRITINSLLNGVHVECPTMEELLDAEGHIRGAAHSLKAYIDIAKTFCGAEEIVEL